LKRKLIFSFWKSPLRPDDEYGPESEYVDPRVDDDEHESGDENIRVAIPTPVGLVAVQPYADMTRAFDFWIGNTNFDVTPEVERLIEACPGVESLEILTRYRFRIGIGLVFDSGEVRAELRRLLLDEAFEPSEENPFGYDLAPDMRERVDVVRKAASEENPFWALIVLPNGNVDYLRGPDKEVVKSRLQLYREIQQAVGGVIWKNVEPH
jgi:hypothetical protein